MSNASISRQQFRIKVIETVATEREYIVEADTLEEAKDKALIGDTIDEFTPDTANIWVVNRVLDWD